MLNDFKKWFSYIEPEIEEIRQMIDAVYQRTSSGIINCVQGNGPDILIISEDGQPEKLLLVSSAQRHAFLDFLEEELFRRQCKE
ncbi:MAG TPA: hypothetical protein VFE32_08165 [Puia sp.]|jgi:hypothetical protein|nr:hypothetical protein [Puia sp.]